MWSGFSGKIFKICIILTTYYTLECNAFYSPLFKNPHDFYLTRAHHPHHLNNGNSTSFLNNFDEYDETEFDNKLKHFNTPTWLLRRKAHLDAHRHHRPLFHKKEGENPDELEAVGGGVRGGHKHEESKVYYYFKKTVKALLISLGLVSVVILLFWLYKYKLDKLKEFKDHVYEKYSGTKANKEEYDDSTYLTATA